MKSISEIQDWVERNCVDDQRVMEALTTYLKDGGVLNRLNLTEVVEQETIADIEEFEDLIS